MRRTTSIDVSWHDSYDSSMDFAGRARDVYTPKHGGNPVLLNEGALNCTLSSDRTIESISTAPPCENIEALVGAQSGISFRLGLAQALGDDLKPGAPLYQLLEDIPACSLVAGWAWSGWVENWLSKRYSSEDKAQRIARMENVCTGFQTGSSALADFHGNQQNTTPVPSLVHPDDPLGWHHLPKQTDVALRRARRIDIWQDDLIRVDATFQDSAPTPEGGRKAVHEYALQVTACPEKLTLLSIQATPGTLPYRECPGATENVDQLLGAPLEELRTQVLTTLRRTKGCTHLNDALRALADVPLLLDQLKAAQ